MGDNRRRIYKINKMKSHYIGITWQSIDGKCHYTKVPQKLLVKFLEGELLPATQNLKEV